MRTMFAQKLRSFRGPRLRPAGDECSPVPVSPAGNPLEEMKAFDRPGADLPRRTVETFAEFQQTKVDLVSGCEGIESLRDFGGLYGVHGKYLLEPAVRLKCRLASMVDETPRDEWEEKKATAQAEVPGLEVEFVRGDFRDPALYPRLSEVDASILFEVILHQENYVEVIKNVASRTRKWVCLAQPCLRESFFPLPGSAVLLQFYPQALKDILRVGSMWPEEPPTRTFATRYWMWGQTTSHLIATLQGFGWELAHGDVIDKNMGEHWEYPLLRFRRCT